MRGLFLFVLETVKLRGSSSAGELGGVELQPGCGEGAAGVAVENSSASIEKGCGFRAGGGCCGRAGAEDIRIGSEKGCGFRLRAEEGSGCCSRAGAGDIRIGSGDRIGSRCRGVKPKGLPSGEGMEGQMRGGELLYISSSSSRSR